MTKHLR